MPHSATVTGKTGPDRAVTAMVIPNVVGIEFDLNDKRLFIETEQGYGDNIKEFDLSLTTAVTVAISAGNWTVTVA
jgi:hypothetical protein